MRRVFKWAGFGCLSLIGLIFVLLLGARLAWEWQYGVPTEGEVRQDFATHRSDYFRFVELLKNDPTVRFVEKDGTVNGASDDARVVPAYRDLLRQIGAKFVIVGEDGSMEFPLGGFGCAICSDSYMGLLYLPKESVALDLQMISVDSFSSSKLPHENGAVATGLYAKQVEPGWYIYREEYQE